MLNIILLILLKLLCLTHNSVRQLRKIRDVNEAQQKSNCILLCVKINNNGCQNHCLFFMSIQKGGFYG